MAFQNTIGLWKDNQGGLSAYLIRIISGEIWRPFMEKMKAVRINQRLESFSYNTLILF